MAELLDRPPTKANLIDLREGLGFIQTGHSLLEQKREILVKELLTRIAKLRLTKKKVEQNLRDAYKLLGEAAVTMGPRLLNQISLAAPRDLEVQLGEKSIMGVEVPFLTVKAKPIAKQYSMLGTNASLDLAREKFFSIIQQVLVLAELETAIYRLALEFKKNQKRVNALENIFIPQYKNTIKFIDDFLEERDREELFVIKRLKDSKERQEE